jgi:hypothetical protein
MDPAEVAHAVDRLDGVANTLVAIDLGGWEVMVGGGPDRFVVTATSADRVANAVTDHENDDETIDLTVGEQTVDYPARYVLTREQVDVALIELAGASLSADRWEH